MAGKNRQAVRGGGRAPLPFWVWLLTGFAAGVALSMFFILRDGLPDGKQPRPQARSPSDADKPLVELAAGDSRAREADGKRPPRYDFYQVLPEMEVVIPDAELASQTRKPPEQQATPANTRLFLQVGSFTSQGDAEAQKARLALIGVQSQVVPVTINDKTWHRVRVGPYSDARALDAAKRELANANYEAIALRETGG